MRRSNYLVIILLLIAQTSFGQIYQNMAQPGYKFSRARFDSVLTIPTGLGGLRNITGGQDTGQIRFNLSDSSVYVWNGRAWIKPVGGGSGSIDYVTQGYGIKVDSSGRVYTVRVDSTVVGSKTYIDAKDALKLNISDTANNWVGNIQVINDSTIRVYEGSSFTDLQILGKANAAGTSIDTTSLSDRINLKQNLVTLTTTGTSGAATLINDTLNIPDYATGGGSGSDSFYLQKVDYVDEDFPGAALPSNMTAVNSPTYTVSGGKIRFTSTGSTTFAKYVRFNGGVLTETNTIQATYNLESTPSTSTSGVAIGFQSYNTNQSQHMRFGLVTKSDDANYGKVYLQAAFPSPAYFYSSYANTNINSGDVISISCTRQEFVWSITATNITQGWSVRLDTATTYAGVPFASVNSAYPTLYHLGGNVSVDSFKYSINVPAYKDLMIIGNSITAGFGVTTTHARIVNLIGSNGGNIFSGGSADVSGDVVNRLGEIVAIRPKRVLFHDVRGNDITYTVPFATSTQNIKTIDSTLAVAGIETIWTNGQPRNTTVQTPQKTFFDTATFLRSDLIIDTWTPLVTGANSLNTLYNADGIHPNNLGAFVTAQVIDSALGFSVPITNNTAWVPGGNYPATGAFLGTRNAQPLLIKTNDTTVLTITTDGALQQDNRFDRVKQIWGNIVGGATDNYGVAINNTSPNVQFFTRTTGGWSWNSGGTRQPSGTNEMMRLTSAGLVTTGIPASIGGNLTIAGTITGATTVNATSATNLVKYYTFNAGAGVRYGIGFTTARTQIFGGNNGVSFNSGGDLQADGTNEIARITNVGMSIKTITPSAYLTLGAGVAAANGAPLRFTSGTNLTTPVSGAVEFDGTNYFVTSSTTRFTLAKTLVNTATLDFGNTVAGAATDLTITVTGAADGDAVSIGVPNGSTVANGSYTAWVSATNTVTIRFSNSNLVTALDPASGTFRAVVLKY
jgi:hypothetical protein